ncbi:hypothetical protein V1523DRAFT_424023 [Lipomyces doorenjongii]
MEDTFPPPRELTIEEIHTLEDAFATSAKNAFAASFDGVEIYGAPRRPIYQEREQPALRRSTVALSKTVPNLRLRSSTNWPLRSATRRLVSDFQRFNSSLWDGGPLSPVFVHRAYIHMIVPRVSGGTDHGGFTAETAKTYAAAHDDLLVAFGRYFISNPDLVAKVKERIPFTLYNRDTVYLP